MGDGTEVRVIAVVELHGAAVGPSPLGPGDHALLGRDILVVGPHLDAAGRVGTGHAGRGVGTDHPVVPGEGDGPDGDVITLLARHGRGR